MDTARPFESYPAWMVALSVLQSLAIYALGAYLVAELGWAALLAYVALLLWVELRLLQRRCVDCHYYGKLCGLGRGAIAPRLFKRGEPQRFAERKLTWYSLLPDLAVALVPLLVGLALSITRFARPRLAAVLGLALVWLLGTALVRGKIACAHCAQRHLGCPAGGQV